MSDIHTYIRYVRKLYVTYVCCILHTYAVCYIRMLYVTYVCCMLHTYAVCYIRMLYVTYICCMLHMYVCCMLHTYAVCYIRIHAVQEIIKLTFDCRITHISGNIGNIFNLEVWQSGSKLPNLYIFISPYITYVCTCTVQETIKLMVDCRMTPVILGI